MDREKWLDVAKFVAIYLVVIHHVRDYAGDPAVYSGMGWLENLSSVFNVAVFFAISGYLSRGVMSRLDWSKLVSRVVFCLWPLVSVVTTGYLLFSWVLTGTVCAPPDGWVRTLLSVGWFFGCLVICEAVTFIAHALAANRRVALMIWLALVYAVIWLVPVGLCHALEMVPFYWFGMFALPRLLNYRYWPIVGLLALTVHVGACIVFGDFVNCGLSYHYTTMHLLDFSWKGFLLLLARAAIGLCGACGGLLTIKQFERLFPSIGRLAFLGTQTLGVFYFHILILSAYFVKIGWAGGGLPGRLTLSLLVFVFAHGLVVMTRRIVIVNVLLWKPLIALSVIKKDSVKSGMESERG